MNISYAYEIVLLYFIHNDLSFHLVLHKVIPNCSYLINITYALLNIPHNKHEYR